MEGTLFCTGGGGECVPPFLPPVQGLPVYLRAGGWGENKSFSSPGNSLPSSHSAPRATCSGYATCIFSSA